MVLVGVVIEVGLMMMDQKLDRMMSELVIAIVGRCEYGPITAVELRPRFIGGCPSISSG